MIELILVLIGIHFTIVFLAAAYRIIDLWYDFERHWLAVVTKLGAITCLGALTLAILPFEYGYYLVIGIIGYLLIHLGVWLVGRLILLWLQKRTY